MQIIELYIKGYNRINGSAKSFATNKLIDSIADFTQNVVVGNIVTNLRTQETVKITAIDSATQLSLSNDIFTSPNYDEYRIESDYFRADLFEDESVTITDSLLNVRDIGKIFTPFSQQFNLPASKLNNQLFRHYENQDVENSFDARYRHDAIIKLNGIDYKKGKIQFKSVTLKDNKAHAYKVVFFGDTVELKEVLGETKLSGLLYPDSLNFEYTQNNITNFFAISDSSLESIYGSTDIVVPNIHHSKNMRYTNSGYLDTNGVGLSWVDLKPAIRLKAIIDAIENTFPQITFNEYSFWNVSGFRQFYMWMHRNEGYVTNATEGGGTQVVSNRWKLGVDDYTFTGNDPSYAAVGDVRGVALETPVEYYRFQVNIQSSTTEDYTVKILKASTGETIFELTQTGNSFTYADIKTENYGYGELDIIVEVTSNNTITMTQDVEVTKFRRLNPLSPLFTIQWIAEYDAVISNTGNTFYINKNMPDMKVMDFLSGLFKMFNLVVFKEGDKIDVQLAKFYMNQGTSYDITKYVDMSSSSVERLFQYKEMDFKFKSKKTFLVQKSDEIQGIPFSEEDYPPSRSEFDGGVYKVELPFEKMMYERLTNPDNNNSLTNIGQGAFLNQQFEPTIGEPLIMCVAYQQDVNDEITIDGGGVGYYRRPTQLSNFTWGYTTRLQLNFGLEADEFLREIPSGATNLFQDGYLDYVETVFDRKSRLLKVSAYLPLSIILKYKLKDTFVINNKSYRINKIKTNLLTNKTDLELYNKDEFVSQVDNAQFAYLDRVAQVTVSAKSTDFITITWSAVSNVVGYDIILNGGVFSTEANTVTTKKITGLESGTTYNIGVRAKYSISGTDAYSFDTTITETTN